MASQNFHGPVVGVLAVQGDFAKHAESLSRLGVTFKEIRSTDDFIGVDRLIIPGGESTTVGLLLQRYGLGEAIQKAASEGMPIWGTCMGMIMMASGVNGRPDQYSLKLLDIDVERNAFGSQVHSFEDAVPLESVGARSVLGVFIRAPIVTRCGPEVQTLSRYRDKTVAVRQGVLMGTSFHPELTDDLTLHRYFIQL